MKIKILTGMCAFILSGIAFADCPSSLNAEKTMECITVEGSGENYQDWQKNEYEFNLVPVSKASNDTEVLARKKEDARIK
jgi:hypothetical protein